MQAWAIPATPIISADVQARPKRMSRFKVSKYRSAFPAAFKREHWIHDLNVGVDPRANNGSCLIQASCENVAFISDFRNVGSVCVLPLSSSGRNPSLPQISGCHSGVVSDFGFSFFDDNLLSTCGEDGTIKLWNVSDKTCKSSIGPLEFPLCSLKFHPQVDNLMGLSHKNGLLIYDLERQTDIYTAIQDNMQAFCWSGDGTLIGAISKNDKGKCVRVYDPRQKESVCESVYHSGVKGSSIAWMGDTKQFVTTGYGQSRNAEMALWNVNDTNKPVYVTSIGSGSGVPLVFFDEDTNMLYSCVKGESSIYFYELQDKSPNLSVGQNYYSCNDQIKGLCLIPKQAVNVLDCELSRVMVLTQNAIVPVSFKVQRKSHGEFHGDLFPDTAGPLPADITVTEWLQGNNKQRNTVSLNPINKKSVKEVTAVKDTKGINKTSEIRTTNGIRNKETVLNSKIDAAGDSTDGGDIVSVKKPPISFVRASKVRYIEGKTLHKSLSIQNLPKLSTTVLNDSNGFAVNNERFAFCLFGPGGPIGIYEIKDKGRLDANKLIKIENGSSIMDFAFDPFDTKRLAVGLDTGSINIWNIHNADTPIAKLTGHYDKISCLAFHPQANDVLATSGYDCKIIIWDLSDGDSKITLETPEDNVVHSLSWSGNGEQLAGLSRDNHVTVYDPRKSNTKIIEGQGSDNSRGGRIIWLNESTLLTTGFDRTHCQMVCLFTIENAKCNQVSEITLGRNPSTLVPYYDPDINVIYLSGKGDTSILTIEYNRNEHPFLFQAATFNCQLAHQAIGFLPKTLCDISNVQVAMGVRLCASAVEMFGFTIPRVRKEYFQDDLYPKTLEYWISSLPSSEWFGGSNKQQKTINLCPSGMKHLSDAPQKQAAPKKYESFNPKFKSEQEKKEELITAMIGKMGEHHDDSKPQADTDGVDSDEWGDD